MIKVDDLIDRVSKRFPRVTPASNARYFEVVHQDITTLARALEAMIDGAPVAIMSADAMLAVCAIKEEDFPALYALAGKKVRLVEVQ